MISHEQKPEYLAFAEKELDTEIDPETSAWMTRLNADGSISAVVVFRNFSESNCEMLIASDGRSRWATREFIGTCYRYAFNQMGVDRVTVIIERDNEKSIRLCRRIGHLVEGILRKWSEGKDAVIMGMTREECKWLGV